MPDKSYRDLSNAEVFDVVRKDHLVAYHDRVPMATQAGVRTAFDSLMRYTPATNQFLDGLINVLGMQIVNNRMRFENPLRIFKSDDLIVGDSVQEIYTGLLRAHSYDPHSDAEDVFRRERPETKAIYHKVNRQEFYHLTVSRPELEMAFLGGDKVQTFIDQLMDAPYTSAQIDEFLQMIQLLPLYHTYGGFFYKKAGSREIADDGGRAKNLLKAIRAMAGTVKFPSTRYNAAGMPSWIDPSDLVIFTTPEIEAEIDVDALAAAFNMERMNVSQQIITIPEELWPLDGVHTVLTTKWFFRVFDKLTTGGEITNPKSLHWHTYYHVWQILSMSTFAPAIAFTHELETITVPAQPAEVEVASVAAIDVYPRNGGETASVSRGGELAFDATLTVENDEATITSAIAFEVRGNNSPRTYITRLGSLHVGADETASSLTVRAYQVGVKMLTNNAEVTIAVVGPVQPHITNNLNASGPAIEGVPKSGVFKLNAKVGVEVNRAFEATSDTEVWSATGLPAGLVLDAETGVLSGTPTVAGEGTAVLTAANEHGDDDVDLQWTVSPA